MPGMVKIKLVLWRTINLGRQISDISKKSMFIVIMTDVSVCQTEGFQAVWRFLRLFHNLQIMTH
jgi:hypothetical protein